MFFSVDRFPDYVEPVAWILPMTHVIELVRPLTSGQGLGLGALLVHLGYLVALCVVALRAGASASARADVRLDRGGRSRNAGHGGRSD